MRLYRSAKSSRSIMLWGIACGLAVAGWGGLVRLAGADDPPPSSQQSSVLARVGTQAITPADVDFFLGESSGGKPGQTTTQLLAIELLAKQVQALQTLRKRKLSASSEEVDAAIRARAPLEQQSWEIARIQADFCQPRGLSPDCYRNWSEFRLAWPRYLSAHLTEQNMSKLFAKEQGRFDGTRFKIDWMSLPVPLGQSAARADAQRRLAELRQSLVAESYETKSTESRQQTSLAQWGAANRDASLVRERWIVGTGELHPACVSQLLGLASRQWSMPFDTPTAVNLIRQVDIQPGSWELAEVRSAIRSHMLWVMLDYLAQQSQTDWPLVMEPQQSP